jgi:type I site-specific restriction endonuclease
MACGSGLTREALSLTHRSIEAMRPGEAAYRVGFLGDRVRVDEDAVGA